MKDSPWGVTLCRRIYLSSYHFALPSTLRRFRPRFLHASLHLYNQVCPSVCPSVRPSVYPSVRPTVIKNMGKMSPKGGLLCLLDASLHLYSLLS